MIKLLKKLSAVVCAGAAACAMAVSVFAGTQRVLVNDNVMSSSQASECQKVLEEAADDQNMEFLAVFMNDSSVSDYAVETLARNRSNEFTDGAVLVVNYATRYTYIALAGKAKNRVTDAEINNIFNRYVNDKLRSYDHVGAVEGFVKGIDKYTTLITPIIWLVGIIVFLICFFVTFFIISKKYKFHEKPQTNNYLAGGALNFGVMQDVFVSEHTSRTAISSSGGSGGGGGGGSSGGGGSHF